MTLIKFANALAAVALASGASATLANDSDVPGMHAGTAVIVAMGENLDNPDTITRNRSTVDSGRIAAPLVVSERPPRPPVALTRSPGRSVADGSRISARHMFPPRDFPRW